MKYVTVREMVSIEQEANQNGLTYELMMENAGKALAEVILEKYRGSQEQGVLGLVGSGNNGGDTLVALAYLAELGWKTAAYILRERPEEDSLVDRYLLSGGMVQLSMEDPKHEHLRTMLEEHKLILDGVLGTGIKLPLKPELASTFSIIQSILASKKQGSIVVAVDCPSGVDCDSGDAAPECIPADLTVTMAAFKQGLLKFPAYNYVGDLRLVGIGLPKGGEDLDTWKVIRSFVPDQHWIRRNLPLRPLDAHKGTFGTALVIAGSLKYSGASLLAGIAAFRAGAGLVTLAIPAIIHSALAGQFLEATWLPLPYENGVIASQASSVIVENLERVTAVLLGPGFGLEPTTADFMRQLFRDTKSLGKKSSVFGQNNQFLPPVVIDADGLKLLSSIGNWWQQIPHSAVITPHPGEMSVLSGLSISDIQSDRLEIARHYAGEWGHIVVLKGAFTTIAAPDGQAAVIPVASPSLARAGTGDVLAGLIVGLLAQGCEPFHAAVAGAWIHAQAGLYAAEKIGNTASVLAGDVLQAIESVLTGLQDYQT